METTIQTQLGRKPKAIPTVSDFREREDENSFRWLQEEYRNNDYDDNLVQALNCLNDEERNLLILFIVYKRKLAPMARYFHVSTPFLRKKLNEVRERVICHYEAILEGKEEKDYRLEIIKKQNDK